MSRTFDVIIIGTGPAGEGAAMRLAKAGKKVAIIEKYQQIGGGCVHWGTIPSKALRHLVELLANYRDHPLFQQTENTLNITFPQLLKQAKTVSTEQVRVHHRYYIRNEIEIIYGFARFIDKNTLMVNDKETLTAEQFIIATGSSPYNPPDIDFKHPHILDSDGILDLTENPRSITIYGAGVIGCEYASIFANLDIKVNLINSRNSLLSFLDSEITTALTYHLREQGVLVRHNAEYDKVVIDDNNQVILSCKSGAKFRSDIFLWANGRSGNTADMGLKEIGLKVNHREQIEVNECFQTTESHIYAVGDVIGAPGLASASYDQGRFAGNHIVDKASWTLLKEIPSGIFTSPEISCIGKTEAELTTAKIPYQVGKADFKNLARAQIENNEIGMLKILFDPKTEAILGIHCFGDQAAEILHIGQVIMMQKGKANRISWFTETTFNYPTMAEAYRVAALNGLNRRV